MKTNQHNTIIYFLHNLQIENISRSYKFIKFIFIDRSKDWPKRKKICWHEFCKEFRLLRPRRLTGRGGASGRGRRERRGGEGVRSFANSKRARTRPRLNIAEIESINFLVPRKFRGLRRVNFAHLPRFQRRLVFTSPLRNAGPPREKQICRRNERKCLGRKIAKISLFRKSKKRGGDWRVTRRCSLGGGKKKDEKSGPIF